MASLPHKEIPDSRRKQVVDPNSPNFFMALNLIIMMQVFDVMQMSPKKKRCKMSFRLKIKIAGKAGCRQPARQIKKGHEKKKKTGRK